MGSSCAAMAGESCPRPRHNHILVTDQEIRSTGADVRATNTSVAAIIHADRWINNSEVPSPSQNEMVTSGVDTDRDYFDVRQSICEGIA